MNIIPIGLRTAVRLACLLLVLGAPALLASEVAEGEPAPEPIATLEAVSGLVEVQRDEDWFEAEEGDSLELADAVRTDVNALARIVFHDGDEESGAEPTIVDLSPETHVTIEELTITEDEPPARTGFLDMVRGALNAVTKGWQNGSIFSVKAGDTVCGIRGSAANVAFDPSDETATVTSIDGEMFTFDAVDRMDAFRRIGEASRAFRARKTLPFVRHLKIGHQSVRRRGMKRRLRKLDPRQMQSARRQILQHRGVGGLKKVGGWTKAFAKIKPTGLKPRKRMGKSLRKAFGRARVAPAGIKLNKAGRVMRRVQPRKMRVLGRQLKIKGGPGKLKGLPGKLKGRGGTGFRNLKGLPGKMKGRGGAGRRGLGGRQGLGGKRKGRGGAGLRNRKGPGGRKGFGPGLRRGPGGLKKGARGGLGKRLRRGLGGRRRGGGGVGPGPGGLGRSLGTSPFGSSSLRKGFSLPGNKFPSMGARGRAGASVRSGIRGGMPRMPKGLSPPVSNPRGLSPPVSNPRGLSPPVSKPGGTTLQPRLPTGTTGIRLPTTLKTPTTRTPTYPTKTMSPTLYQR